MKTKYSILSILLTLFSVTYGFAQNRILHISNSSDERLNFWYTYDSAFFNKIGLEHLHLSPYSYHFRIKAQSYALEIWKTNDDVLKAQIVNWIREHTPSNEEPTNRFFYLETPLDTFTTNKIFRLIKSSGIDTLRDQSKIDGWKQGLDGVEYIIELSTRDEYYFKTYWTPSVQNSLKDALLVQSFVDSVFYLANEAALWKEFALKIPFESYYSDPSRVTIRANLTKAQRKQYKKERETWRKQHGQSK